MAPYSILVYGVKASMILDLFLVHIVPLKWKVVAAGHPKNNTTDFWNTIRILYYSDKTLINNDRNSFTTQILVVSNDV